MKRQYSALDELIKIDQFFYEKNEIVASHSSLWGDFNFSLDGILEIQTGKQTFLAPPNYALWLPPQTEHCSIALDHSVTHFICIRVHPSLCDQLPREVKTLSIRPFLLALVREILEQSSGAPGPVYSHLIQVLFDQLLQAKIYDDYLPQSHHTVLLPVLQQLADPELFQYSLQTLLKRFSLSERQILRLSQQELGLSISEWRNRAKIIYAISQIRQGASIKRLAYELGYQHSSSFIAFFKRYTQHTPLQLRS
ncbi:bacterial regulatory helix-turn-helix s, AraC family protein [Acinetobacter sp. 1294596]|uniref:AraC family transcriptional regulator n=1 Tax=Acinetobacter TaxID=469 RepID=UPI000447B75A|nr:MULTISPECIES: helix-turn-helix transcriptional regulator [Acinetobacter]EXF56137.1 bacterial regulatory helix-turn-helix s, AraC family protein [Acinetobacter sp. 1294596]